MKNYKVGLILGAAIALSGEAANASAYECTWVAPYCDLPEFCDQSKVWEKGHAEVDLVNLTVSSVWIRYDGYVYSNRDMKIARYTKQGNKISIWGIGSSSRRAPVEFLAFSFDATTGKIIDGNSYFIHNHATCRIVP